MIKAVIVDDEENSRDALKGKIDLFCPEVEIVGEVDNVKDGIKAIIELKPDAVFLDVQLEGENSGFDILNEISNNDEINPEIIFVTAHSKFAIKAIKFSALDYLLKPIDPKELVKAIRKVENRKDLPKKTAHFNMLMENIRRESDSFKKIMLTTSDGMHIVHLSDIIYLESISNYTNFYLNGNKSLLISKTLKEFEGMLNSHSFQRVHRSYLVNLNYVKKYIPVKGNFLVMNDETKVPIASRRKEQVLKTLKNF